LEGWGDVWVFLWTFLGWEKYNQKTKENTIIIKEYEMVTMVQFMNELRIVTILWIGFD